jgi:hypothetical protein
MWFFVKHSSLLQPITNDAEEKVYSSNHSFAKTSKICLFYLLSSIDCHFFQNLICSYYFTFQVVQCLTHIFGNTILPSPSLFGKRLRDDASRSRTGVEQTQLKPTKVKKSYFLIYLYPKLVRFGKWICFLTFVQNALAYSIFRARRIKKIRKSKILFQIVS